MDRNNRIGRRERREIIESYLALIGHDPFAQTLY